MSSQNNSLTPEIEMPSPEASPEVVQAYLIQYARNMCGYTPEEALEWARKLRVNGEGLYSVDETELVNLYGIPGRLLFLKLQNSMYGRVCSYLIYVIY